MQAFMNEQVDTVRLAPPGAGIPLIERAVGALLVRLRRWRYSNEATSADFRREHGRIEELYQHHGADLLSRRILIPRLRGLEDSSRFWSITMTLEHLAIVNGQISLVMRTLASGRVPEGKASTAAVKPRPNVGIEVIEGYERSCDGLLAAADCCKSARRTVRYAHPWFGPLDAAGWHSMAAMHMSIHRNQIARILHGLEQRPI